MLKVFFTLAPTELSDENESNQFMFVQFDDHFSLEVEKRRWEREKETFVKYQRNDEEENCFHSREMS